MSEREFETYLTLMCRLLRLSAAEREATSDELRDHLEQRLAELTDRGISRDEAVARAVAEFGDAAALAAEFSRISEQRKKRWMMRMTAGSLVACVVLVLTAMAFWPGPDGAGPQVAVAQEEGVLLGGEEEAREQPEKSVAPVGRKIDKSLEWSSEDQETEMRLRKSVKANFRKTPLDEVLGGVLNTERIQLYFDAEALNEAGVQKSGPINIYLDVVPLDMLLELVLGQLELDYTIREGIVIVTTPEKLEKELETRVYDVHDLPAQSIKTSAVNEEESELFGFGGFEDDLEEDLEGLCQFGGGGGGFGGGRHKNELIDLIMTTVQPTTWDYEGGPASIRLYHGALVVSQTQKSHREIKQLLDGLRDALKKQNKGREVRRPRRDGGMGRGGMGRGGFGGEGGMMGGGGGFGGGEGGGFMGGGGGTESGARRRGGSKKGGSESGGDGGMMFGGGGPGGEEGGMGGAPRGRSGSKKSGGDIGRGMGAGPAAGNANTRWGSRGSVGGEGGTTRVRGTEVERRRQLKSLE